MSFEQLDSFFTTDVGRVRENNEDTILALSEHGVFCVADGMGGADGGEVASRMVAAAIRAAFSGGSNARPPTLDANIDLLRQAVARADAEIKDWAAANGVTGTGTTLVALVFDPLCPFFGAVMHAGDSRAYRYRNGTLTRLSKDHSIAGALGLEDEHHVPAAFHGIVTQAIGAQEGKDLEENTFDVEEGDLFVVCSDGLTRMVDDRGIAALLREHERSSPASLCAELTARANAAGGVDNVSVGLIRVRRENAVAPAVPAERSLPAEKPAERSRPAEKPAGACAPPPAPRLPPASPVRAAPPPPPARSLRPSRLRAARWIALAAAAVLALVLAVAHRRGGSSGSTDAARAVLPAGGEAAGSPTETDLADVRQSMAQTLESGEWGALKLGLRDTDTAAARILGEGKPDDRNREGERPSGHVRYDEIYRGWLYLWEKIRYSESSATNRSDYISYCAAMEDIHRALGSTAPLETRRDWPETAELQADFVCRETYRPQRILLENVGERIREFSRRLSVFEGDREAALRALCALAGNEPAAATEMGVAVLEAESRILALRTWIERRGLFPLDPEVLREMAESTLPAMTESSRKVGDLLHRNLLALSPASIRACMGEENLSDREVENILILRDRLFSRQRDAAPSAAPSAPPAAWFDEANVEQVRFFLRRLARKWKAKAP